MYKLADPITENAVIKVIGVGGGGGNAVKHMIKNDIEGVDFICLNTDAQALKGVDGARVLQIGVELTKGLGAGADPDKGRNAALEQRESIMEELKDTNMIFIAAGMGGGTGTGAAPIVAAIAKEMGILTVAVVTKPFSFEAKRRSYVADDGIKLLRENVDSLICIPNSKLQSVLGKTPLVEAFAQADDILHGAVQGISDLITQIGMINVDFADVKAVMSGMGMAMMGTGYASGENRGRLATESAIRSPLMDEVNLQGAKGILVNITSGLDFCIEEFAEIGELVEQLATDNATVIVGNAINEEYTNGEIKVTVVVTGIPDECHESDLSPVIEEVKIEAVANDISYETSQSERKSASESRVDYSDLDRPAYMRSRNRSEGEVNVKASKQEEMEFLDVPAFLRKIGS